MSITREANFKKLGFVLQFIVSLSFDNGEVKRRLSLVWVKFWSLSFILPGKSLVRQRLEKEISRKNHQVLIKNT